MEWRFLNRASAIQTTACDGHLQQFTLFVSYDDKARNRLVLTPVCCASFPAIRGRAGSVSNIRRHVRQLPTLPPPSSSLIERSCIDRRAARRRAEAVSTWCYRWWVRASIDWWRERTPDDGSLKPRFKGAAASWHIPSIDCDLFPLASAAEYYICMSRDAWTAAIALCAHWHSAANSIFSRKNAVTSCQRHFCTHE